MCVITDKCTIEAYTEMCWKAYLGGRGPRLAKVKGLLGYPNGPSLPMYLTTCREVLYRPRRLLYCEIECFALFPRFFHSCAAASVLTEMRLLFPGVKNYVECRGRVQEA